MTSLPETIGLIDRCWIADGFSKPANNDNIENQIHIFFIYLDYEI